MIVWTNEIEAASQSWSLKRKLMVLANFESISKIVAASQAFVRNSTT
jgi:hypothetical protein